MVLKPNLPFEMQNTPPPNQIPYGQPSHPSYGQEGGMEPGRYQMNEPQSNQYPPYGYDSGQQSRGAGYPQQGLNQSYYGQGYQQSAYQQAQQPCPQESNPTYEGGTHQPQHGNPPPLSQSQQQSKPALGQEGTPGPPNEDERGLAGALAGGAAGFYGGHKVHHGLIGAAAGAYAGHKLEDAYKHHHDKPKPKPPTPNPQDHHGYPSGPPPPPPYQQNPGLELLGNFSQSSSSITLDGDYDLIASCTRVDGSNKLSSISLNQVLSNDNGHFIWMRRGDEAGNFGGSARSVRLAEGGRVLEAELRDVHGDWKYSRVHLDERITNGNAYEDVGLAVAEAELNN